MSPLKSIIFKPVALGIRMSGLKSDLRDDLNLGVNALGGLVEALGAHEPSRTHSILYACVLFFLNRERPQLSLASISRPIRVPTCF